MAAKCLALALVLVSTVAASSHAPGAKAGCGPLPKTARKQAHGAKSLLQHGTPGVGMDPASITPYQESFMDGFLMVGCVKDFMHLHGDKHGDGKWSYELGPVSHVSIVRYDEMVVKEDREAMTHEVCFGFCRTIPGMMFFGITHGRDCYCAPYFKQVAGDSSSCDAVCEGSPTTMCGGMSKSSIFEMHSCDDAASNLEQASSEAETERQKLVEGLVKTMTASQKLQAAADGLQASFGKVGDAAATGLFQAAKVLAGKLEAIAGKGAQLGEKVAALQAKAASPAGSDAVKETLTAELFKAATEAKLSAKELSELNTAVSTDAVNTTTAKLYSPVMYFVDKSFVSVPSTCGGKLAADPLVASFEGCAAACEAKVGNCVGFSHFNYLDTGGLCFLFSGVSSTTYYTGCGGAASFLQRAADVARRASTDAKCMVKFAKFEGTSIKPDPSGKCSGCLKEATKAARCFS